MFHTVLLAQRLYLNFIFALALFFTSSCFGPEVLKRKVPQPANPFIYEESLSALTLNRLCQGGWRRFVALRPLGLLWRFS
jgi:hypothetical protein